MTTPSSPKTTRLDKRLLGLLQGSDFHVSLIILMFYKPANQDAQKSHGIAASENFWVFSDLGLFDNHFCDDLSRDEER